MTKSLEWGDVYLDKCMENKDLKKEIQLLHAILRSYLPIIEDDSENSRGNK